MVEELADAERPVAFLVGSGKPRVGVRLTRQPATAERSPHAQEHDLLWYRRGFAPRCSPQQWVDLNCDPDDFPNHGCYVRCVTHVTGDLVDLGLISNPERSGFVSRAARK